MPNNVCCVCGTAFHVPPSRAAARYCSLACMKVDQVGDRNPNWKGGLVTTPCLVCGAPVSVKRSHRVQGEGKTCSVKCRGIWQGQTRQGQGKKRVTKTCRICGTPIAVKVSHAGVEGTYCSVQCMRQDYSTRFAGDKNSHWKAGQGISTQPGYSTPYSRAYRVRKRNGGGTHTLQQWEALKAQYHNACLCCGQVGPYIEITADHIVPVLHGGSNDISNLQPLCRSCNSRKGAKTIDYRL